MTTFTEAYQRYSNSNRTQRADLWTLCESTYTESRVSTIVNLAEIIGLSDRIDSVGDWAKVGWLINYTYGIGVRMVNMERYDLKRLWDETDSLSYDHLLRVAKLAKKHEIDPKEVLERLCYALEGGQKAESLERDIEEAHEDEAVIGRRDLRTIRKRLQQNFGSVKFRKFISDETARLWALLDKSIEGDLSRLEAK